MSKSGIGRGSGLLDIIAILHRIDGGVEGRVEGRVEGGLEGRVPFVRLKCIDGFDVCDHDEDAAREHQDKGNDAQDANCIETEEDV